MSDAKQLWERYCRYLVTDGALGFSLDVSRVRFDEAYLESMAAAAWIEARTDREERGLLLQRLGEGVAADEAFREVLGLELERLQADSINPPGTGLARLTSPNFDWSLQ